MDHLNRQDYFTAISSCCNVTYIGVDLNISVLLDIGFGSVTCGLIAKSHSCMQYTSDAH